jgi:hypothetical protein
MSDLTSPIAINNDWELYQKMNRDRPNRSQMKQFLEFSKENTGWMPLWKLKHLGSINHTKDNHPMVDQPHISDIESKILTNISFLSCYLLKRSELNQRVKRDEVQRDITDFKIVEPYDTSMETFAYQKDGEWYRMSVFPNYETLSDMESDYLQATNTDFWIDRRTLY